MTHNKIGFNTIKGIFKAWRPIKNSHNQGHFSRLVGERKVFSSSGKLLTRKLKFHFFILTGGENVGKGELPYVRIQGRMNVMIRSANL